MTDGYEDLGDVGVEYRPSTKDRRRQKQAVEIQEWVEREVAKAPPLTEEQGRRIRALLFPVEPPPLTTWRLRLFCGHLVDRSAHRSYTTVQRAFASGPHACPKCGLSPATIVAGRALVDSD
jgi:hypothetical protein